MAAAVRSRISRLHRPPSSARGRKGALPGFSRSGALNHDGPSRSQTTEKTGSCGAFAYGNRVGSTCHGRYVDEVLSYTVGTTRYFTHANHLYSIAAVTDGTGSVVERYHYDAYGKRTVTIAVGTAELAESTVSQMRGFTGYIRDDETGLYHARARMYSSELGRFISRDPLGYVDGANLYGGYFVPIYLDPYGTFSWKTFASGLIDVGFGILQSIAGGAAAGAGGATAPTGVGTVLAVGGVVVLIDGLGKIGTGLGKITATIVGNEDAASQLRSGIFATAAYHAATSAGSSQTTAEGISAIAGLSTSLIPATSTVQAIDVALKINSLRESTEATVNASFQIADAINGASQPSPQSSQTNGELRANFGQGGSRVQVRVNVPITLSLSCPAGFSTHQVKSGDTIWALWRNRADKNISWEQTLSANSFLEKPDFIIPGWGVCKPAQCGE